MTVTETSAVIITEARAAITAADKDNKVPEALLGLMKLVALLVDRLDLLTVKTRSAG